MRTPSSSTNTVTEQGPARRPLDPDSEHSTYFSPHLLRDSTGVGEEARPDACRAAHGTQTRDAGTRGTGGARPPPPPPSRPERGLGDSRRSATTEVGWRVGCCGGTFLAPSSWLPPCHLLPISCVGDLVWGHRVLLLGVTNRGRPTVRFGFRHWLRGRRGGLGAAATAPSRGELTRRAAGGGRLPVPRAPLLEGVAGPMQLRAATSLRFVYGD